ncbi:MAG TPA: hypothetical protein VF691_15740 [Cytophagaceae bacterium]|jgi:hypothetical protein
MKNIFTSSKLQLSIALFISLTASSCKKENVEPANAPTIQNNAIAGTVAPGGGSRTIPTYVAPGGGSKTVPTYVAPGGGSRTVPSEPTVQRGRTRVAPSSGPRRGYPVVR